MSKRVAALGWQCVLWHKAVNRRRLMFAKALPRFYPRCPKLSFDPFQVSEGRGAILVIAGVHGLMGRVHPPPHVVVQNTLEVVAGNTLNVGFVVGLVHACNDPFKFAVQFDCQPLRRSEQACS